MKRQRPTTNVGELLAALAIQVVTAACSGILEAVQERMERRRKRKQEKRARKAERQYRYSLDYRIVNGQTQVLRDGKWRDVP